MKQYQNILEQEIDSIRDALALLYDHYDVLPSDTTREEALTVAFKLVMGYLHAQEDFFEDELTDTHTVH